MAILDYSNIVNGVDIVIKIKKYGLITYTYFKQARMYWQNVLLLSISGIITTFISCSIWMAIYMGRTNNVELENTIKYIVFVNIINMVMSNNLEMDIGKRVMDGTIAIDLLKPLNYIQYIFFQKFGLFIFKVLFFTIPIGILFYVSQVSFEINFAIIISLLLTYIMTFTLEILVGLGSFLTTQVFGLSLVKSSIINIAAGLTIPLYRYPDTLQTVFNNLPFQSIYCSALNISNGTSSNNVIQSVLRMLGIYSVKQSVIIEQIFWLSFLVILGSIAWRICKRRLTIQGG